MQQGVLLRQILTILMSITKLGLEHSQMCNDHCGSCNSQLTRILQTFQTLPPSA